MKFHDYTERTRGYGHDYTFTPTTPDGKSADICGWGHGLRAGDVMMLSNPRSGGTAHYLVDEIEYYTDPRDMFSARATWVSRSGALDLLERAGRRSPGATARLLIALAAAVAL